MPTRYEHRFADLHKDRRKAFIPCTLLGWPDRDRSLAIISQMIASGASALELCFAFSDPVADGPIIQQAASETIASGFSVSDGFSLLKAVREIDANIPIGILVYYNLVLVAGIEHFFEQAKKAGVDGILIADLPIENMDEVRPAAKRNNIDMISLISPISPAQRIEKISQQAQGFIYLIARLGVTGVSENESSGKDDHCLADLIAKIKAASNLPVCAGFGIGSGADATRMFKAGADGVISASRVIQLAQAENSTEKLSDYYTQMLAACSNATVI